MDLINTLAGQLGVDPKQAQALAGSVLGGVQSAVAEEEDKETAKEMEAAIPELSGWKAQAASMLGGADDKDGDKGESSGGLGGLFGAASSALGGGGAGGLLGAVAGAVGGEQARDVAAVVTVLNKLGIDSSKASLVAPTILNFVKERVSGELLSKILSAAPLLAMVSGGDDKGDDKSDGGGGLGGLLGGLLK